MSEIDCVGQFEKRLSDFFGSRYAVAVDSCTHAVELCLRYLKSDNVTCPIYTYPSIPFTFMKLDLDWKFDASPWKGYYYIGNTPIIDAATFWQQNGYIRNTFMCLSFQYKKHLNLCRGGAILLDDEESYKTLKMMSHDGRLPGVPWKEQNISMMGFHYYMPIETAELGLKKIDDAIKTPSRIWTSEEYPDLRSMRIFHGY